MIRKFRLPLAALGFAIAAIAVFPSQTDASCVWGTVCGACIGTCSCSKLFVDGSPIMDCNILGCNCDGCPMACKSRTSDPPAYATFEAVDVNGDGSVTKAEVNAWLAKYRPHVRLNRGERDAAFKRMDRNRDGVLNAEECGLPRKRP